MILIPGNEEELQRRLYRPLCSSFFVGVGFYEYRDSMSYQAVYVVFEAASFLESDDFWIFFLFLDTSKRK